MADKGYLDTSLAAAWEEARYTSSLIVAQQAASAEGPQPLTQYQTDPLGFCVDVLGVARETLVWSMAPEYATHTWDGTVDPLLAVLDALVAWQHAAVESATGTGKSFLGACVVLWFLAAFPGARVFTFAPKEDQLRKFIWAEIGKLWPRFLACFPSAELNDLALYVDGKSAARESWSAFGYSVAVRADEKVATKAAGMHAEHMLLITEETPGIDQAVIEAHENTCTAPHNLRLALGNPDAKTDTLHGLFKRPSWKGVRISALDHPNVVTGDPSIVPGAVSPKSILARLERYRTVDHPLYLSRVRGIPPDESRYALIRLAWVETAHKKWREWLPQLGERRWPHAIGADPSQSKAGDYAGLAHFVGPICVEVTGAPCPNAQTFGLEVWAIAQRFHVEPQHIGIDPIGVGASTFNAVRALIPRGTALPEIGGALKAVKRVARAGEGSGWVADSNRFPNLRCQMWWQLRDDLEHGRVGLPDDPELTEELIALEYNDEQDIAKLESKDDLSARLGRSPNKADAVVYANWVRARTTPLDTAVLKPDDHHLGWKKVNGKRVPMTAEDQHRETVRVVPAPHPVKRWWRGPS